MRMDNLINEIIAGSRQAFESLVEKYQPMVRKTVSYLFYRYRDNNNDAMVDDLTNDIFLSLMEDDFKKIRQFKGMSSFATYLRVIASRQVLGFLRRPSREVQTKAADRINKTVDSSPNPEELYRDQENRSLMAEAIAALKPADQLLMKLTYYQELSAEETARIMNISLSAFYSRKSRIVKKIENYCIKHGYTFI